MKNPELLFGEETFLIDEHLKKILEQFPAQDILRFNDNAMLSDLSNAISMTSLFTPANAIIIKNPKWLTHSADDKDLEQLTHIFSIAKHQPHTLVIVVYGSYDQRKKAAQLVKKHCQITQYSPFKDWEQDKVLNWIQNRVKIYNKTITKDALIALEQIGGSDLRQMAAELEKLDIYTAKRHAITKTDVDAMCAPSHTSTFDFTESLKSRKLPEALGSLKELIAHGEDPIKLLGLATASFRLYLQLLLLNQDKKPPAEMATILGKNPYFIQKLLPDVRSAYTIPKLCAAYAALACCDFEIKTGKMKPEVAIELAIVKALS